MAVAMVTREVGRVALICTRTTPDCADLFPGGSLHDGRGEDGMVKVELLSCMRGHASWPLLRKCKHRRNCIYTVPLTFLGIMINISQLITHPVFSFRISSLTALIDVPWSNARDLFLVLNDQTTSETQFASHGMVPQPLVR